MNRTTKKTKFMTNGIVMNEEAANINELRMVPSHNRIKRVDFIKKSLIFNLTSGQRISLKTNTIFENPLLLQEMQKITDKKDLLHHNEDTKNDISNNIEYSIYIEFEIQSTGNVLLIKCKKTSKLNQILTFTSKITHVFINCNILFVATKYKIYVYQYSKKHFLQFERCLLVQLLSFHRTDTTTILECRTEDFFYISVHKNRHKNCLLYKKHAYKSTDVDLDNVVDQTGIKFIHNNYKINIFATYITILKKYRFYKPVLKNIEKQKEMIRLLNLNFNSVYRTYKKNKLSVSRKYKYSVHYIEEKNQKFIKILRNSSLELIKNILVDNIPNPQVNFDSKIQIIDYDYHKKTYVFILYTATSIFLVFNAEKVNIIKDITTYYMDVVGINNLKFIKKVRCAINKEWLGVSIAETILIFSISIVESEINFRQKNISISKIKTLERFNKGFIFTCNQMLLSLVTFLVPKNNIPQSSKYYDVFKVQNVPLPMKYELIKIAKNLMFLYNNDRLYMIELNKKYPPKIIKIISYPNISSMEIKHKILLLVRNDNSVNEFKFRKYVR